MRQALDVDNKQIDFIPYVSAHHSMMHVLPSIALALGRVGPIYDNNSYVLETDDLLSVTWNFDLELHEAQEVTSNLFFMIHLIRPLMIEICKLFLNLMVL